MKKIKNAILTAFRWLSFKSIIKFFDLKEIIVFIIPMGYFYYDFIKEFSGISTIILILFVAVIVILLMLINVYKGYLAHEKSIAEILETGYFTNFIDKTAYFLKHKLEINEDISISFKDDTSVSVKPSDISFKIILPTSNSALLDTVHKIDSISKYGTMENGPWVIAKVEKDNKVTIYECPRTLLSLRRYVDDSSHFELISKKLHKYFNQKFDSDWKKAANSIPNQIITRTYSFEE